MSIAEHASHKNLFDTKRGLTKNNNLIPIPKGSRYQSQPNMKEGGESKKDTSRSKSKRGAKLLTGPAKMNLLDAHIN